MLVTGTIGIHFCECEGWPDMGRLEVDAVGASAVGYGCEGWTRDGTALKADGDRRTCHGGAIVIGGDACYVKGSHCIGTAEKNIQGLI